MDLEFLDLLRSGQARSLLDGKVSITFLAAKSLSAASGDSLTMWGRGIGPLDDEALTFKLD